MRAVRFPIPPLTAFLSFSTCFGAIIPGRGLGERPPTAREAAHIAAVSKQVTSVAPNELARSRERAEVEAAPPLDGMPTAVDNSTLQYFPPIRSQGSLPSCVPFSINYYQLTHMVGLQKGWNNKNEDIRRGSAYAIRNSIKLDVNQIAELEKLIKGLQDKKIIKTLKEAIAKQRDGVRSRRGDRRGTLDLRSESLLPGICTAGGR